MERPMNRLNKIIREGKAVIELHAPAVALIAAVATVAAAESIL